MKRGLCAESAFHVTSSGFEFRGFVFVCCQEWLDWMSVDDEDLHIKATSFPEHPDLLCDDLRNESDKLYSFIPVFRKKTPVKRSQFRNSTRKIAKRRNRLETPTQIFHLNHSIKD